MKNKDEAYALYTTAAYWFYNQLIEPAVKGKKMNSLMIITDDELGHLPFESFLVEIGNQKIDYKSLHYLVKDYNISYNYSATLWKENAVVKNTTNNGKMLACAADYSPVDSSLLNLRLPHLFKMRNSLQTLPEAQKEVAALSEIVGGDFLSGDAANEGFFKKNAKNYGVIHLAMHGILDVKTPMLSSLAFTENRDSLEDNFLQAYEISKMQLNADLVVLSACETGYGKFEKGEGVLSLARSFMYAGVPSLVVSLWQVNDYSTSIIMTSFYQYLVEGMPKDVALRQAKLDYLKTAQDIAAHPAFWSPFIQLGDSKAIYLKTKTGWLPWAIGGGLLVLGLGVFAWRKGRE